MASASSLRKASARGWEGSKRFFFRSPRVETVAQEGEAAEAAGYGRQVIDLVCTDFYTIPVKRLTAKGFEVNFIKKLSDIFFYICWQFGSFGNSCGGPRLSFFFQKARKCPSPAILCGKIRTHFFNSGLPFPQAGFPLEKPS